MDDLDPDDIISNVNAIGVKAFFDVLSPIFLGLDSCITEEQAKDLVAQIFDPMFTAFCKAAASSDRFTPLSAYELILGGAEEIAYEMLITKH